MTGDAREEVTRLLAENRRLRELLTEHGDRADLYFPVEIASPSPRGPSAMSAAPRGGPDSLGEHGPRSAALQAPKSSGRPT